MVILLEFEDVAPRVGFRTIANRARIHDDDMLIAVVSSNVQRVVVRNGDWDNILFQFVNTVPLATFQVDFPAARQVSDITGTS